MGGGIGGGGGERRGRIGFLYTMGFYTRWVSIQDGFLYKMGFYTRWVSIQDGFLYMSLKLSPRDVQLLC